MGIMVHKGKDASRDSTAISSAVTCGIDTGIVISFSDAAIFNRQSSFVLICNDTGVETPFVRYCAWIRLNGRISDKVTVGYSVITE